MDDHVATALYVLGPLEVVRDGERVRLGSGQQRRLLAVLLTHANEVVSSDRLVDVLWADDSSPGATHTPETLVSRLQTLVSRLRATLGDDRLQTRPPGYRLRVASGEVDALRFEELMRVGLGSSDRAEVALHAFDEALGLWRGSPYAEFASEEFATAEVARLVELRAITIEERSAALLALGRPGEVIGELETEIAVQPFRERLRALLMLALARSGRPVESLRAYDTFRRFLADEIGVAPSPGLQELNDDIVRQHPNVSWAGSPTKDAGTAELPTGTLTFLFTDLEGSTRLWEEHPEAMHEALARHDEILRVAIGEHGGYIVKPTGDGVHAAFGTAEDALAAAIAGQRAVADEAWGATGALRVRMGLHTGAAEARDGDYYGSSVNRAARVMSVAHGGQVVLSHATEEVVCDSLVGGVELVDLGEHRLRDLARAERLFQLCAPGLATEFPSLRSLDAFPGNLPLQLTSFVGRDAELSAIAKALDDWRLVTLTGVGGVGKTRVALQLAAQVLPEHPDGAWLCELVPATDRDALERLVGATLRVLPQPGLALVNAICDFLRSKRVLLLFDNCEHLLDEVGRFAETLLHECPKVRILATSREALGVPGERILGLRSLALPDPSATVASIATTEASRLFVERAGAARADFALDDLNAGAVAEICRRLDGIPLAIELAAARVVALRPMEIAALLDERFRLLAGGVRTGVERHRTLRATVEWSYSLLAPTERTVFDRLGVFSGSFDARAALSVVATEGLDEWDARETLSSLVAKSVVVDDEAPDGTTRYRLLETLRQYALERLGERGDVDGCRRRHAAHYVAFAEAARPGLRGPDEYASLPRVEIELDNIRAALSWAVDRDDPADAESAIRIVVAFEKSNLTLDEFGVWADRLVGHLESTTPARRTDVLALAAIWNAVNALNPERGHLLALESVSGGLAPESLDADIAYSALVVSSIMQGQIDEAMQWIADGHRAIAPLGDPQLHLGLHTVGAIYAASTGHYEIAHREAEHALAIARQSGQPSAIARALFATGLALERDDPEAALAALEEALAILLQGSTRGISGELGLTLAGIARLSIRSGDVKRAVQAVRDGVAHNDYLGRAPRSSA